MSYKVILLVGAALVTLGWGFKSNKSDVTHVSSEEIVDLVNQGSKASVHLIDLRTPEELKETGMIPGAMVHNFFSKDFESSVSKLDKEKTYIVYCKSGGRSAKAAKMMDKLGLKVKDYSEGITGWLSKEHKTVQSSE